MNLFTVNCFGQKISVDMMNQRIAGNSPAGKYLLDKLAYFSRLSILRYLIHARNYPPSEELVRPDAFPGGDIFSRGSHLLPLDRVATHFDGKKDEFNKRGNELGGVRKEYGDVSIELSPFPRVPITLILWEGDEEFPANCSLLFEKSCIRHLPPDILCATSMLTVNMVVAVRFC